MSREVGLFGDLSFVLETFLGTELSKLWLVLHAGKLDFTFSRNSVSRSLKHHIILCLFFRNMCVPENEKDSLKCTCTIYRDRFVSGLTYILALQFNGTDMWNYTVTPALVGKNLFTLSLAHLVPGFAILANFLFISPEQLLLVRGATCRGRLNAKSICFRNLILD